MKNTGKLVALIVLVSLLLLSFTSTFMVNFTVAQPSETGLLGYWKLDEGAGTITVDAADSNDGSLEGGASWVQGQVGNAVDFNGAPDQVFIGNPNSLKLNESFTLEAWVNNQDYAGIADYGHHVIISHGAFAWMLMIEGNRVVGCWNFLTAHIVSSAELSLETWYHVAWTNDANTDTEKIYVNGVESAVYYGDIPYFYDPWFAHDYSYIYNLAIGNDPNGGSGEFVGMIDEVAVYDRALTQQELSQHYQNGLLGIGYFESPEVPITVTSNPAGTGLVKVDGTTVSTPYTFNWAIGSTHSLEALSPVESSVGTQYVWTSWSDGGDQTHNYIVPSSSETISANYKTQHYLTMTVTPSGGGTVSPGSGWQDAGTISITATAHSGYIFASWVGSGLSSYTGITKSTNLILTGPITETANFYMTSGFLPPLEQKSEFKGGSTIPVKFQLQDAQGRSVSDAVAQIYVDGNPGVSSGSSNDSNYFRYIGHQYIFNLSTKGLTTGTHTILATLSNGETISIATITLK